MSNVNSLEIVEHFAARSNLYDKFGTWVNNDTILSFIKEYIPEFQDKKLDIVDLGAGTGVVSKYIFREYLFNKSITAVDICAKMLSAILEPEIKKCVTSVESMPFANNTFDVAVSRQCLHYVEQLEQAIEEIKRILKKDGVFILAQIVPIESEMKEYWSDMIRFRQPLRKHYFSENDWINSFVDHGFNLLSIERFSHRGSINKWANKYNINDSTLLDEHKRWLLKAPQQFIEEYNVLENEDDVSYNSFWFVAKFSLEK